MKKFLLPLLAILLFAACKKADKITVCHYDVVTRTWKTIEVSQYALAEHLKHGDLLGACPAVLTTTICNQVWMVKNLDVTTYRNGDTIPQVTDPFTWTALTTGAWCYYASTTANGTTANGTTYGKLYNWYAVHDPRGLAPAGWHVPSDAEWTTLETCLGGDLVAGGAMKETGTTHWISPNTGATNSSGFTGLPGGARNGEGEWYSVGTNGYWWSSTEASTTLAWSRLLFNFNGNILRYNDSKRAGFSVRCLRN